MPWGTTLVVIGAVASPAMQQALVRLAERGRRVLWLYCGSEQPPRVPGFMRTAGELYGAAADRARDLFVAFDRIRTRW